VSLGGPEFVASVVSACGGRIRGRTYLQKLGYFVAELSGMPMDYEPQYYGPYSASVASATSVLVAHEILSESSGHSVFETGRYTYRLQSDEFIDRIKARKLEDFERVLAATTAVANTKMARSPNSLAVAAKVHSVLARRATEMTARQLVEAAQEMGWGISEDDVADMLGSLADPERAPLRK